MKSTASNAKSNPLNNTERRQVEAAKTNRLRALRLAKEAEDREAAARVAAAAAANPPRAARRRVRPAAETAKPESA